MNKENAAQYLPLVKALAEGKTIQVEKERCGSTEWKDLNDPEFGLSASSYRIKPEPLECWVVCSKFPNLVFGCPVLSWGHKTRQAAEAEVAARHDSGLLKIIHMREAV